MRDYILSSNIADPGLGLVGRAESGGLMKFLLNSGRLGWEGRFTLLVYFRREVNLLVAFAPWNG